MDLSFRLQNGTARVFLNVDGLGENNSIAVAVTDERFHPIQGLTTGDCEPVENGLRSPVLWRGNDVAKTGPEPVRLKISFEGLRVHDIMLYATYVDTYVATDPGSPT